MGASTYVSISMHSTKSQRKIITHFHSSWTCSTPLGLPGYTRKSTSNMHTTSYALQRGMNPKWHSKPVMDHLNGELCHSDFPMPQQCFSDLSTMYWRAFWTSVQ